MANASESSTLLPSKNIKGVLSNPPGGSVYTSSANLSACAFGASMLSLPYVLHISGPIWGIALLLLTGALSMHAAQAIYEAGRESGKTTYAGIARAVLGIPAGAISEFLIAISLLLAAITYVVGIADLLPLILPPAKLIPRTGRILLILLAEFWPTLISDLSIFGKASAFACAGCYLLAMTMLFQVVSILTGEDNYLSSSSGSLSQFHFRGVLYSLSITAFVYAFHFIYADTIHELKDPTPRRVRKLNLTTFAILACCYVPFTVLGYIAAGTKGHIDANVLTSFGEQSIPAKIARISITLLLLVTYPLLIIPLRRRGEKLLHLIEWVDNDAADPIVMSGIVAALVGIVASFLTDLGDANAIAGGCLSLVMYLFPGLFLISLERRKESQQDRSLWKILLGSVLVIVSVLASVLGLFGQALFPEY